MPNQSIIHGRSVVTSIAEEKAFPQITMSGQKLLAPLQGKGLKSALDLGAIALLDSRWIVDLATSHGIIQRRQDLPVSAFISSPSKKKTLSTIYRHGLRILCLSHMWLHPSHPDPKGYTLQLLAAALFELGGRWAVFWDFASLHQHDPATGKKRTEKEEKLFRIGLESIAVFFGHPMTIVFRVTQLPAMYPRGYNLSTQDARVVPYEGRGWTVAETAFASLSCRNNKSKSLLDISDIRSLDVHGQTSSPLFALKVSPVPLSPRKFRKVISSCSFMNKTTDLPVLCRQYEIFFKETLCQAKELIYTSMGWGDEEVIEFAKILESYEFPKLERIDLSWNNISLPGFRRLNQAIVNVSRRKHISGLRFELNQEGGVGKYYAELAGAICSVAWVDFSNSGLTDHDCVALVDAIKREKRKPTIMYVYLTDNFIGDRGVQVLLKLSRYCPKLKEIDLSSEGAPFKLRWNEKRKLKIQR